MTRQFAYKNLAKYAHVASARKKDGYTILDGIHLIQEAYKHDRGNLVHVYYTRDGAHHREIDAVLDLLDEKTCTLIDDHTMQKIAPTKTPQGIIGLYKTPIQSTPHGPLHNIILLDHVADPGNVGTIIRTAAALGCDAVFLSAGCADVWSPKVLRAAQGAHFYLSLYPRYDLTTIKDVFPGTVYGTFLADDAINIYETNLTGDTAICFGNEGDGIDKKSFSMYGDKKISIPMDRDFESLNVAISVAICLGEKKRQILKA